LRYRVEVRLLRRRRQITDRHVLDHAAAKRADLSHWKTSCLKGWASKNPRSSQTGGDYGDRSLTAALAASFNHLRYRQRTFLLDGPPPMPGSRFDRRVRLQSSDP